MIEPKNWTSWTHAKNRPNGPKIEPKNWTSWTHGKNRPIDRTEELDQLDSRKEPTERTEELDQLDSRKERPN